MGEIQNENQDLILDLNLEQKFNNQLKKLLREQPRGSNKTFELKGHSSILFANLAAITLASCGTSSGSTDYSAGAPSPTANAAPNAGADFTFDFTEDIPASFGIGAPTDADGDVLTITVDSIPTTGVLTTSDGDVITQGMTLVAGQLEGLTFTPNANLNDDNTTPGTLVLTASDGSLSDSATFTFIVYAVNDLPTSIDLTSTSIAENVAGIAVGTVSSDDGDLDNTFTISGTDADKFELSNGTLKLKDTITADYETQTSYSVVITATDSGSTTSTSKAFTISVADSIEPETISGTVVDGLVTGATVNLVDADGTIVATAITDANGNYTLNAADNKGVRVVADGGTDSYTGEIVTITLSASKTSKFVSAITTLLDIAGADAATVQTNLGLPAGFDPATDNPLETLGAQKINAKLINIIAVGEGLLEGSGLTDGTGDELVVTQLVASIKAAKDLSDSSVIVEILTNSASGTTASTRVSELASEVSSSVVNANSLVDIATDVTGIAKVQEIILNSETGVTKVVQTAASGTAVYTSLSTTELTTSLDMADIAGNQAPIDIKLSATSVLENSVGATVGTLSSTDPDAGETFTYSLSGTDADSFEISGTSLKLKSATTVNYETKSSYSVSVTTTDSGNNTRVEVFTISVSNVNEAPSAVSLSGSSVTENSAGATIGSISTTDEDSGETFTYTLSGTDASSFEISEGSLKLKNAISADYETKTSYSVTLTATDSGGNTKSQDFTISVNDLEDGLPRGQAIDGYLVGATVFHDVNGNGIQDTGEPFATTDQTGAFELDATLAEGDTLYVKGGYDLGTGKPNDHTFKLTVSSTGAAGGESLVVSPVSTQVSRAYAKSGVTLEQALAKVGAAYGLDEAFPNLTNFDPIALAYGATTDAQAKAALTAQAKNIMVSTLGEVSKKVSEYFTTEIAPTVRKNITNLFSIGTQTLRYSSWDSNVDLKSQPRISIELEGFEALLAQASETFNDKIIEAILSSTDIDNLFEMKKDGTGQFDLVINEAVTAIVLEIKNTILAEMGFDPATNFTSFKSLDNYDGETVTFLGSTKTMGEWAVLMADVMDSQEPYGSADGKVHFGPDGGVTDMVGKYFAESMVKMARLIEEMVGKPLSQISDSQLDTLVDMGMEYSRASTYDESYTRWIPFDSYGQELWEQSINFTYNNERFRFDSDGNRLDGNSGQWQLTADQIKAYLKDPNLQLTDGNWGNEFTTYNWQFTQGDLGLYMALAEARNETEVATLMDALTTTEDSIVLFKSMIDQFFAQGGELFKNLATAALDFTLDKFTQFVDKSIQYDNDEVWLPSSAAGLPVSTVNTVEVNGVTYELTTTKGLDWLVNPYGNMNMQIQEAGDYTFAITGGADGARFRIDDAGTLSFKDTAPGGDANGRIVPDDANTDGVYLVEVTVTEGDYSEIIEMELKVPQWNDQRTVTETYATLDPAQQVINIVEHTVDMTDYRMWDEETQTDVEISQGYKLNITIPEGSNAWVNLRDRDDAGNLIKDNAKFWIRNEFDQDTGTTSYYLIVQNDTFDYENPQDANGDNVYELQVEIRTQPGGGMGGEQTTTSMELLVVVSDGPEPALTWPNWLQGNDQFGNYENAVAVGSAQKLTIDGTVVDAFFAVGQPFNINAESATVVDANDRTKDLISPREGSVTYTISGGADAAKFGMYGSRILFLERPEFDNPGDADGDNRYEIEISATNGTETITKAIVFDIQSKADNPDSQENPTELSTDAQVFVLNEVPDRIGNTEDVRQITGSSDADFIKISNHTFQYIDGGAGDDVLDPGRDWGGHGYITGGAGADTFIFRSSYIQSPVNFGIRDHSDPSTQNKNGIQGYDENRDGTLDLASELDHSQVPIISDFTPGVDKIGLGSSSHTGFNVPILNPSEVSFVQGSGEFAAHTIVITTGGEATDPNRADQFPDGYGILGVLLNVTASELSSDDIVSLGAQYDRVLGNIEIGATTVTINDADGNPVKVQQLPDGSYVMFQAVHDATGTDNDSLWQNFAVTTDGVVYVPRVENLDYENPKDGNKDNIYEFLIVGYTFSTLVLEKQEWGGYWADWQNSVQTGAIAFSMYLDINDDISDNIGGISIAEASFLDADGNVSTELVELVLKQISAVQSSMADIDFRAIAEEIGFDFEFFAMADDFLKAEEWFADHVARSYEDFGREMEETFEQNLLSKYDDFTDANDLSNLSGDATDNTITGTDINETMFGKAGDDTLSGGAGDDVIFGDAGDDHLTGGPGSDSLDGGPGSDVLVVDEGNDVLDGGAGNDFLDFTNLTTFPEFASGGSGEDTLVMAGMSTQNLEYDDNDSDGSPDYTGIDLQKVISLKETWTDQDGNTEIGWRNRIESIERIDLRDSQSSINKNTVETKLPIDGFRLSQGSATLTDYLNSDSGSTNTHKIYTSLSGSTLNANLIGGTMDQTNLSNIVSSDSNTGKSPVISFNLDSIPAAGSSGTTTVTMKLYDGSDAVQASGERLLETTLTVNWTSDGTNVVMTFPAQTLTVNYYTSGGNLLQRTWENVESDVMTVTKNVSSASKAAIEIKIASFFSDKGQAEGVDLTNWITSGNYFYEVSIGGLDIVDYDDNAITKVQGSFTVADVPGVAAYVDDVTVNESAGTATVTVTLSKAAASAVTVDYETADDTALEGSDYTSTSGTLTIAAGETSGNFTVPITSDSVAESLETFSVNLTNVVNATLGRDSANISIENPTIFTDVLNISLDTLWQMSWDSRTWTIRGDSTDTVRLLGYESSYDNSGDGNSSTFFEPFRLNGTQTIDGVVYNVYDLWDARVLIEQGVTVVYSKRDLGKSAAGENSQPDFWYKYGTVEENQTDVYKVQDSWDQDGDVITFSLDPSYGDYALFNINSSTGEITFKTAPDFENPGSTSAVNSGLSDFSAVGANQMRWYNQYAVRVIANDGSGEANATKSSEVYINVRNLPDYAGYDPTNKLPFFKEMWGDQAVFIDDASSQSIQIKGFDLDFDTLTWTLLGVSASGNNKQWTKWGETEEGTQNNNGKLVSDATNPLELSSTGLLTPKTTLNYETDYTSYTIYLQITDGKSDPVKKQYYFNVKDTIDDGTLTVNGNTYLGSGYLIGATVWQDLDNDGVKDVGEPSTTSGGEGYFSLQITKSDQDAPILASGGIDSGSGLANDYVLKVNSNLKLATDRDWGEYALSPLSTVSLTMQNADRSLTDKKAAIDVYKALGFEPGWNEGDGNFYGSPYWNIQEMDGSTGGDDWSVHNINVYSVNNLLHLLSAVAAKGGLQIAQDVLADVNAKIAATANVGGTSSQSLSATQQSTILQAAYHAALEAVGEIVSGKTAYDGFRLGTINPVTITDHEGATNVVHTPGFTVANNVLTLDSGDVEVNQATMQSALDLESGAQGLKVQVKVGSVPTSGQTISFTGKLIDGTDSTVDTGERAIEVRFDVTVDPTKTIGASDYVFVPGSSDITVIYTGEDGTVTSSTVTHSGNMVTIEVPESGGSPVFTVDLLEVFQRGIPETNLSTYFTTPTVSNGNYYSELTFTGANLATSDGDTFTKVIAPFKVAATTTPVAYLNPTVEVSESRGWSQVTVTLSKPATESFTLDYRFTGGDATQGSDYWWWSDQSGYRQVSFTTGQSTAVINLDVNDDSTAESTETFNIELSVASGSENSVILGTELVTVSIKDNDSGASGIENDTIVSKVLSKIESTVVSTLKAITDGNNGTLNGVSNTYSDILVDGNSDVSDITTYLTAELAEDNSLYDSIISGVMDLLTTWFNYARGPNDVQAGYKIDAKTMANNFAALDKALDTLVLSEFVANAADSSALQAALIADIYSDSGFKYTSGTTIVNQLITPTLTIDNDAAAYQDLLRPGGNDYVRTQWEDRSAEVVNGTSGNDTITLNDSSADSYTVNSLAGAGDDVITVASNKKGLVYGQAGNDRIISESSGSHRFDGGQGNDTLGGGVRKSTLIGGDGADVFVIEHDDSNTWDSGEAMSGWDNNNDGQTDLITETNERPGIVVDFVDGTDKIGLRGDDWSGKTIVVSQGTGSNSAHTFLYQAKAEHSDSDAQIWLILANTTASNITDADFLLVDSSYNTSTLSGVTISTDLALAQSLPSIAPILPVGSGALGETDNSSSSSPLEGGTDFLVELEETGIDIDGLISTSALDVRSNESELTEIILETEAQNSQDYNEVRSDSSLYFHSMDLLEEEDILISFDSI